MDSKFVMELLVDLFLFSVGWFILSFVSCCLIGRFLKTRTTEVYQPDENS